MSCPCNSAAEQVVSHIQEAIFSESSGKYARSAGASRGLVTQMEPHPLLMTRTGPGSQGDTPMMGAGAGAAAGAAAVAGAAKVEISARMLKKAPAKRPLPSGMTAMGKLPALTTCSCA